jgi:sigma-B regulation protein RsbU (phosphoserine phosphatase)
VPPLIRPAGRPAAYLEVGGFPLGSVATVRYHEAEAQLAPGDLLVLVSDGVIETMGPGRELFGFDGLAAVLDALPPDTGAERALLTILDALQRHAAGAEQHDDITLIVVRVLAGATTPTL